MTKLCVWSNQIFEQIKWLKRFSIVIEIFVRTFGVLRITFKGLFLQTRYDKLNNRFSCKTKFVCIMKRCTKESGASFERRAPQVSSISVGLVWFSTGQVSLVCCHSRVSSQKILTFSVLAPEHSIPSWCWTGGTVWRQYWLWQNYCKNSFHFSFSWSRIIWSNSDGNSGRFSFPINQVQVIPVRGISLEAALGSELDEKPLVNKGYHFNAAARRVNKSLLGFESLRNASWVR